MTDHENRQSHLDDERLDSLMESFFESELPAARLRPHEIVTVDSHRVAPSSNRRFLVLAMTALCLFAMANIFWQPRKDETSSTHRTTTIGNNRNIVDPNFTTPVVRPEITRIPRVQNRQDKVILPEGQEFGRFFSQVDERREHVDSKTGRKVIITAEEFEFEFFPIPEKETDSKKRSTKSLPEEKKKTKSKKSVKTKNNSRLPNII